MGDVSKPNPERLLARCGIVINGIGLNSIWTFGNQVNAPYRESLMKVLKIVQAAVHPDKQKGQNAKATATLLAQRISEVIQVAEGKQPMAKMASRTITGHKAESLSCIIEAALNKEESWAPKATDYVREKLASLEDALRTLNDLVTSKSLTVAFESSFYCTANGLLRTKGAYYHVLGIEEAFQSLFEKFESQEEEEPKGDQNAKSSSTEKEEGAPKASSPPKPSPDSKKGGGKGSDQPGPEKTFKRAFMEQQLILEGVMARVDFLEKKVRNLNVDQNNMSDRIRENEVEIRKLNKTADIQTRQIETLRQLVAEHEEVLGEKGPQREPQPAPFCCSSKGKVSRARDDRSVAALQPPVGFLQSW